MKKLLEALFAVTIVIGFLLLIRWAVPHTWVFLAWLGAVVDSVAGPVLIIAAWVAVSLLVAIISPDVLDIRVSTNRTIRILKDIAFVASALVAGAAVPISALWYRLGVPPVGDETFLAMNLFSFVEFIAGITTIVFGAMFRRLTLVGNATLSLIGITGLVVANGMFFVLAPAWTIETAAHARARMQPERIRPAPCPTSGEGMSIVHLSDLHITDQHKTRDGKTRGNERLDELMLQINELNPSYLVISGDLTDTGDAAQWKLLREALPSNMKVVISPGNHDLNGFFGRDPAYFELKDRDAEKLQDLTTLPRIARALLFQSLSVPEMKGLGKYTLAEMAKRVPTKATLDQDQFKDDIYDCTKECAAIWQGSEYALKAEQGCYFRCSHDWRGMRLRQLSRFRESFPWSFVDTERRIAFFSLASVLGEPTVHSEAWPSVVSRLGSRDPIRGVASNGVFGDAWYVSYHGP